MTETLRNRATSRRLIPLIAAAIALSVHAGTAHAQSIGNLSVAKGGTNSADEVGTGNPRFQRASAVAVQTSTSTSFTTRYSFLVAVDYDGFQILGANRTEALTANYTVSFQATAPGAYRLNVSTSLLGDINRIADGGGGNAQGSVSATTGSQTGGTLASGSLGLADPGDLGNGGGAGNVVVNQSGSAVITGVSNGSPVNHTLTFSGFNPSTNSAVSIFGTNAPEVAVRGGIATSGSSPISAGAYPGSPSRTQANDGHFVTVTLTSLCGNGTVDAGFEDCDLGVANGSPTSCCTSSCKFRTAGTTCRGSLGVCDPQEVCSGASGTCPVDSKSTAQCRASAGICDIAEFCDGVNNDCPSDAFVPNTTVCRTAADFCDVDEFCTGSTAACPTDVFKPSSTECRASAGICDVAEFCTGSSAPCPTDVFQPSTTECRPSVGVCDIPDFCTGSSAPCTPDAKSTAECRAVGGICDVAEFCDGINDNCPTDVFAPANTRLCRPASDLCDEDDYCNGLSRDCVVENISPTSKLCRPNAGNCDAPDFCDGAHKPCPADQVLPSTVKCRDAAGFCDVDDYCDGVAGTCGTDNRKPNTVSCRALADACDLEEFCDGGVDCPADAVKPDVDSDGLCDEQDNCPQTNDPTFADDDGDGRGNVCDACTFTGVPIVNPAILLKRIDTPASDDTLKFTGEVTVAPTPTIDPIAKGIRFRFEDPDGQEVLDVTIPGGAYNAALRSGWKATTGGWKYKNVGRIVPLVKGINNITLTKDRVVAGKIKFKFTGKKGFYPVFPDEIPLKVSFVVDAPFAQTGQCGESLMTSLECLFDSGNTKLQCENPN
ncbi:hypothetical protein K2Z84_13990 [Candidatus Binatia bacterium]|nr:hypothetical protein [Candidatus Binatia bacterium]